MTETPTDRAIRTERSVERIREGHRSPACQRIYTAILSTGGHGIGRAELMVSAKATKGACNAWCRALRLAGLIETTKQGRISRWCAPGMTWAAAEHADTLAAAAAQQSPEQFRRYCDHKRSQDAKIIRRHGPPLPPDAVHTLVPAGQWQADLPERPASVFALGSS